MSSNSAKVKIVCDYHAIGSLLKGNEVKAYVYDIAKKNAASLGDGYTSDYVMGQHRWIASVWAVSGKAIKENLEANTLLRSLHT